LSKFTSKKEETIEDLMLIEVYGSFECHICGDGVEVAKYSPQSGVLGWKCEQGHKSVIEKFRLA